MLHKNELSVNDTYDRINLHKLDGSRLRAVDRYASAGKRFCDLDLWTRDLENLISSWPDCEKYLCKFWSKSHLVTYANVRFRTPALTPGIYLLKICENQHQ